MRNQSSIREKRTSNSRMNTNRLSMDRDSSTTYPEKNSMALGTPKTAPIPMPNATAADTASPVFLIAV
jgi:hypothetical protein